MKNLMSRLLILATLAFACATPVFAAEIDRFAGTYSGSAEYEFEGRTERRDMSVTIVADGDRFDVSWTSISHKSDGREKEKSYTVSFAPTDRPQIFGSAMRTNMFGKRTQLNPLEGEPFVWSRIIGDTLTVFSLFIDEEGTYEMQEYHRTLVDGGLDLRFLRVRNAVPEKEISAFLERQD